MTLLYCFLISLIVPPMVFLKVDYNALHDDVLELVALELKLNPDSKIQTVPLGLFNAGHPLDLYWLFKHWTGPDMDGETYQAIREYLPSKEDLKNVALSLVRLQEVYDLTEVHIARGDIYGQQSTLQLETEDFQFIGKAALDNMNFKYFHIWYKLAIKMAKEKAVKELILKEYNSLKLKENLFTELLKKSGPDILKQLGLELSSIPMATMAALKDSSNTSAAARMFVAYRELCRHHGSEWDDSWINPRARCIYDTRGWPLQPFKLEIYHERPLVMVIHDLIPDSMSKTLSQLSHPHMETPRSISSTTGKVQKSTGRVGKMTFIPSEPQEEFTEKFVDSSSRTALALMSKKIRNLSGQVTGLDGDMAERLQVVSYGIGGHYEPHVDYFHSQSFSLEPDFADRMATLLFYLNNVKAGGATVFPYLGISVSAVAGSALFWHNLDPAGTGYKQTMHAGCPVLLGYKEVANLWFLVLGQHHTRPCQVTRRK